MGIEMTEEIKSEPSAPRSADPPKSVALVGNNVVAHPRLFRVGGQVRPLIPTTVDEIQKQASIIAQSGVVPKAFMDGSVVNKALVGMVIMKGLEVGFAPLTALEWIMEVNGRLTVWGDGAMAILQGKQLVEDFKAFWCWTEKENDKAVEKQVPLKPFPFRGLPPEKWPNDLSCLVKIKRVGGQWWEGDFSIEQAKTAHLWRNASKKPWMEYPDRMLFNRARAYVVRDGFSDALNGLLIREELEDIGPEPQQAVDTSALVDDTPVYAVPALTSSNETPITEVVDVAAKADAVSSGDGAAAGAADAGSPAIETRPAPDGDGTTPAVVADDSRLTEQRAFRRELLRVETTDGLETLLGFYAHKLEDWRLNDTVRYSKIMDEVSARRDAFKKRRR